MIRTVLLLQLIFFSAYIFGQSEIKKTKQFDAKLYTNFDFIPEYISYESDTINGTSRNEDVRKISGFNFSPSFGFKTKKGNSYEIEVSRLKYSNNYNKEYIRFDSTGGIKTVLSGNNHKQFELYLRYEYKLNLFKSKDWEKFKPIIGLSATPFVTWNKSEPVLSTEFPISETVAGLYLSVVPRIEYFISEKWYLDFNIPVAFVTGHYKSTTSEDPSIALNERTESVIDFYNGPVSFAVRFGLGYKI